jgi:hypothetical protein
VKALRVAPNHSSNGVSTNTSMNGCGAGDLACNLPVGANRRDKGADIDQAGLAINRATSPTRR